MFQLFKGKDETEQISLLLKNSFIYHKRTAGPHAAFGINIHCTCIKREIDQKQNKQNPCSEKQNGDRNLAIIQCHFLTLATIFYSLFDWNIKYNNHANS